MPILANAKKALRSSQRKAKVNRVIKTRVKTATDSLKAAPSSDNLSRLFGAIDKAVKANLFHRNKAARLKSKASKLMPSA